ncbi:MAG: hypothetical protein QOD96_2432, partial [Pseudonocardiales bacterium]|nr:hypothetical protein [Pseudonocardiales bacterium]
LRPRDRDDLLASADVDGAVAAGGAHELQSDQPAVLEEPANGEHGGHDAQVRLDRLAFVVVDRPGRRLCLDIRNERSLSNKSDRPAGASV